MGMFFLLLFSIPFLIAYGIEINPYLLQQKISKPHCWLTAQIEEDLSPFYESGISKEMIEKTIANIYALPGDAVRARLARVKIENNEITITKLGPFKDLFSVLDGIRVPAFKEFFSSMAEHFDLPNIEFLLCLWDYFDNPVYVEAAECPIFTISKRKHTKKAVLFPEVQAHFERVKIYEMIKKSKTPSWQHKIEKAHWRGRTTGGIYTFYEWDMKPRPQLCLFSQKHPDLLDAGFATTGLTLTKELKNQLIQADLFLEETSRAHWLKYKYLIAIDGNSFASSLWWELLSTSVTLKGNSDFIEWFYKGIEPWVHYVPFEQDCSDLKKQILWLKNHDKEAQEMVERANAFALDNLTVEDMMAYFYHLLKTYAKLQRF